MILHTSKISTLL